MKAQRVSIACCDKQSGVMLLEALIAILIFSFGILGIVALQAVSVKLAGDAKYRTDAALLAEDLMGQMWVSDRNSTSMSNSFGSAAAGVAYTAWLANVSAALPGTTANPPTVVVDTSGTATDGTTTITVRWQAPSEANAHAHVVLAQIK